VTSSRKANRGPSAGPENRRALITAARDVFGTDGFAAPLSAVARKAGVGQGSLYRHFPDRMALAVAVFDENITALEEFVELPDTTLDDLLNRVIEQALVSTAIIDMISAHRDDPRGIRLGDRLKGILERLLNREKEAGRIGSHVSTDDVLLAVSMLAGELARSAEPERAEMARRAWTLFHAAFAPH
jgi:AcrR family transcriptional regulator